ncbi:MAG TPA: glutathione peroxidase [Bacteroidales bacterium]|nr:glutathione peroxidase [Bacteroidales bacterium]HOS72954.1 glutathione peroxidase [Bacteroidales bacterium]HQH23573.1 glutathione peroxidase [Bacteroidales bacterium]HQJ81095.1 glutathione peroxidase [Bacteroidales bacterium]
MKNRVLKTGITILFPCVMLILMPFTIFSQTSNFYSFKIKTLEGNDFNLDSLKGKKVMVVNTASKCGYTPQYKDLQELYEQYSRKLVIIGFPANNFGNQEPGTALEIRQFCTDNYNVTFPMMEKISVRGEDIHPLYKWLTSKEENGVMDSEVKWNFQKYLIDEEGKLVDVLYSKEKPGSEKVISWLNSPGEKKSVSP